MRRDGRLPQEFKDKLEKWDYEMKSSVMEGLRRARGVNEESLEEEPMVGKKIVTEKDVLSVIEGRNQAFFESLRKDFVVLEEAAAGCERSLKEEKQEPLCQEEIVEVEPVKIGYSEIDLKVVGDIGDLMNLGPEHLKNELSRLGLKCGGSLEERKKRLFEIKMNPNLLFNPKYIAKKSRN